ncbi:translation initiation factor IF-2-like [Cricetulus griseus]|uniref:Translation initiation factor IF-2-like n=1 Tax=Cricetulus griseus TaxID=10029 RepID=A0A9J7H6V0_CRIGR|nr:translation initiation factor IF-2-like [Cricetulus griseus]
MKGLESSAPLNRKHGRRESPCFAIHPSGGLPEEQRLQGGPLPSASPPPPESTGARRGFFFFFFIASPPGKEHVPRVPAHSSGPANCEARIGRRRTTPPPRDQSAASLGTLPPSRPRLAAPRYVHPSPAPPPPPTLRYPEAAAARGEPTSSGLPLAAEVPRERDGALGPRPREPGPEPPRAAFLREPACVRAGGGGRGGGRAVGEVRGGRRPQSGAAGRATTPRSDAPRCPAICARPAPPAQPGGRARAPSGAGSFTEGRPAPRARPPGELLASAAFPPSQARTLTRRLAVAFAAAGPDGDSCGDGEE